LKLLIALVFVIGSGLVTLLLFHSGSSRRGDKELAQPTRTGERTTREPGELSLEEEGPGTDTDTLPPVERFSMPYSGPKTAPLVRRRLRGGLLADGRPMKEGRVEVRIGDRTLAHARSGDFGRFEIEFVQEREEAYLITIARGFVPMRRHLGFKEIGSVENIGNLRLMRGLPLFGRVRSPRGDPVAGAEVEVGLGMRSAQTVALKTVTDEFGKFEFREAPNGQISITAVAEGYGARRIQHSHGSTHPVLIQLRPAHTLRLRLHDGRGFPVAGAEVELTCSDPGSPKRKRKSDAEGRLLFADLGAPIWNARATKTNHRPSARMRLTADGTEHELEVPLWPGIVGQIIVPKGRRLPEDSQVFVLPSQSPSDRLLNGGGHPIDTDGRFRVGGLRPGSYAVHVRAQGYVPYASRTVSINLHGDTNIGRIRLSVGGKLQLVTVCADRPLAGVTCELRTKEPSTAEIWRPVLRRIHAFPKTDQHGRAAFEGLEETVWLILRKEGYVPLIEGPLQTEKPPSETLRVAMEQGGRISGTVKTSEGSRRAGIRIRIHGIGSPMRISLFLNTLPNGTFRSMALPPGTYQVLAVFGSKSTGEPVVVLLEAGEEFRLDLTVPKAQ